MNPSNDQSKHSSSVETKSKTMYMAPYIPRDLFVGRQTNNNSNDDNNNNNNRGINYLLVEFLGKKKADQIDFLTNDISSISDMISFLENTITITTTIGRRFDVHYSVIKESANIWEGRLKEFGGNNNKGFTTNQKSKLIKLMEDSVLMKNRREFMETEVTAATTRALLLMIEDDVPSPLDVNNGNDDEDRNKDDKNENVNNRNHNRSVTSSENNSNNNIFTFIIIVIIFINITLIIS